LDGREGWWVVFGGLLTLTITAGTGLFVIPVLIDPITADTGWSLTDVSLGTMVWGLSAALLSPLLGAMIDRFGARRMMIFGCALNFVTTYLIGRVTELWQLYVVFGFAAIGTMSNTFIPVAAVVARWFITHRGIATGIAMLGLGLGGATFPKLADVLLETNSWREIYTYLAFGYLVALVPTLIWVRNPDPEKEESYAASHEGGYEPEYDLSISSAWKTRSFWGISLGDMLTGMIFNVFTIQLVVYLTHDLGDRSTATTIFSLFLICQAAGTLVFGPLADRFSIRGLLVLCYFIPVLGTCFLLPGNSTALAYAFAITAGLAAGGRSAIFPVGLVYAFGETHMASIFGLSTTLFMLGNAFGAPIASAIYAATDSTRYVYIFCASILVLSSMLVSLTRPERKIPAAN
jgi:MFS family permease